jgi:hypothetical protein
VLGMIIDGLREFDDYRICERRFLLKILLTLFDSPLGDSQTQVNKLFIYIYLTLR